MWMSGREREGCESDSDSLLWELSSNINVFTSLALGKSSLPSLPSSLPACLHASLLPTLEKDSNFGPPDCPLRRGLGRKNLASPICPILLVNCAQEKSMRPV